MNHRRLTGRVAACLTACLMLAASPADARWLRRGLLPGLMGGIALGALAGAARAGQPDETVYIEIEEDPDVVETVPVRRAVREPRAPKRVAKPGPEAVAKPRAPAVVRAAPPRRPEIARAASPTLERCREAITANTKRYGSTEVRVASAGAEERRADGVTVAPLTAQVRYAQRGRSQVRQARVNCQLSAGGQVVAIR
ncbi:MAG TPA: hypothetical protein VGU45_10590 [Microvirga sp.]|jgi:hypothetical protein|nr:hypothetical protein [Microvirga sp.]